MLVPLDGQILEVRKRFIRARHGNLFRLYQPPQNLRYFDVDEVRCVHPLRRPQCTCRDTLRSLRLQYQLHGRRGVQHDQRASRSARSTWAGDSFPRYGSRCLRRSTISSGVGCSAILRASRIRKSDRDNPAIAARAFNCRCSPSGTLRSWIIFAMRNSLLACAAHFTAQKREPRGRKAPGFNQIFSATDHGPISPSRPSRASRTRFCPATGRAACAAALVKPETRRKSAAGKTRAVVTVRDAPRPLSLTEPDHNCVQAHQIRWPGAPPPSGSGMSPTLTSGPLLGPAHDRKRPS